MINNGWSPFDTRVGGSEEFIIETATRLKQRGFDVNVYHNGTHGVHKGVYYLPHEEYTPPDVAINVNYSKFNELAPSIHWTSLTDNGDLSKYAAVCYISEYAKNNTNLKHKNLVYLPPGYDSDNIYPDQKISKQCLYASSPDRGLDVLLNVWPDIHKQHPDATLMVTYGADIDTIDGVIGLGNVDTDFMNELYRTSEYWLHPATGGELYCITGIKAQAAGCIPIVVPIMALAETVKFGYFANNASDYGKTVIEALNNTDQNDKLRKKLALQSYVDWERSTDILVGLLNNMV